MAEEQETELAKTRDYGGVDNASCFFQNIVKNAWLISNVLTLNTSQCKQKAINGHQCQLPNHPLVHGIGHVCSSMIWC